MITVTQFNLFQLKTAQAIIAKAQIATPAEAETTAPANPATPDAEKGPAPNAADAPGEAVSSAEVPAAVEAAPGAPAAAPGAHAAAQQGSAEHLATLLAGELKLDEKKATYLVQILAAVGKRLDRIRQVRVVQSEGAPVGAVKIGDIAYIVDSVAGAPRPAGGREDRGGRGAGRRGDRKGGPRGDKRGGGPGRDGGQRARAGGNSGPGGRPAPAGGAGSR